MAQTGDERLSANIVAAVCKTLVVKWLRGIFTPYVIGRQAGPAYDYLEVPSTQSQRYETCHSVSALRPKHEQYSLL